MNSEPRFWPVFRGAFVFPVADVGWTELQKE